MLPVRVPYLICCGTRSQNSSTKSGITSSVARMPSTSGKANRAASPSLCIQLRHAIMRLCRITSRRIARWWNAMSRLTYAGIATPCARAAAAATAAPSTARSASWKSALAFRSMSRASANLFRGTRLDTRTMRSSNRGVQGCPVSSSVCRTTPGMAWRAPARWPPVTISHSCVAGADPCTLAHAMHSDQTSSGTERP